MKGGRVILTGMTRILMVLVVHIVSPRPVWGPLVGVVGHSTLSGHRPGDLLKSVLISHFQVVRLERHASDFRGRKFCCLLVMRVLQVWEACCEESSPIPAVTSDSAPPGLWR